LHAAIAFSNAVVQWIATCILDKSDATARAEQIALFVDAALHVRALHNYELLMTLVGALGHCSVGRLKRTFAALDRQTSKDLHELQQLMAPGRNHEGYRTAIALATSAGAAPLPALGGVMKDLMAVENFHKVESVSLPHARKTGTN
jgi:hypothetical protein